VAGSGPMGDLEYLVARQEVADVLARFCERIDEYDIDAVAELFTEDCVTDYGPGRGGRVVGRQALAERLRTGQEEFARTHHQLGQMTVRFDGPDTCHASTYVTAWHERFDGSTPVVRLRYLDRLVRSGNRWRIAERRALAQGAEGFPGVEWRWVARRRPGCGREP